MNKFKQCLFTVILLATCIIASPIIFKQIWDSSKEKKAPPDNKNPQVDIYKDLNNSEENPTEQNQTSTNNNQPNTTSNNPDVNPQPNTETSAPSVDEPNTSFQYVSAEPSYFDDAIFIGDSRTVGISEYGTLKNASYFCDVGLAISSVKTKSVNGSTLESTLSSKQYGKIYIMLGINEVGNDIEYTMAAFRAMMETIRTLQPNAIIYIQSNLHVTQFAETGAINNNAINILNNRMAEFADYKQIFYIDVNSVFDDENGNLRAELTNDGIHVLAKFYADWCNWMCLKTVPVSQS